MKLSCAWLPSSCGKTSLSVEFFLLNKCHLQTDFLFLSSCQVCSYRYSVPDSRKDCWDGWSDTDGWPAGHVYHHSYYWLTDTCHSYSSHSLFCYHTAKPLYLYWWAPASSGNSSGDLIQVSFCHKYNINKVVWWSQPHFNSTVNANVSWPMPQWITTYFSDFKRIWETIIIFRKLCSKLFPFIQIPAQPPSL